MLINSLLHTPQKIWSPLYISYVQKDYSVDWKDFYTCHTNVLQRLVLPCSIAHMCKAILNSVLDLSLKLEIGYTICRHTKQVSCTYFMGTANRMNGCCCQLVFVTEVSLGYVQYFIDFNYCFQFPACYFAVYRITLIYNASWHV